MFTCAPALIAGGLALDVTLGLSGPANGFQGLESDTFTLSKSGTLPGPVTVTLSDGGAGGTFYPSGPYILTNAEPSTTFTYVPASTGTVTITMTNDLGVTNGAPYNLSVATGSYEYWRVYTTDTADGSYFGLGTLEFRTGSDTAQAATGGTAIASGTSGGAASSLFDTNNATTWTSAVGLPQWAGYQFAAPIAIKEIMMTAMAASQSRSPRDFKIQASADNITWVDVKTFTGQPSWAASEVRVFDLMRPQPKVKVTQAPAYAIVNAGAKVVLTQAPAYAIVNAGAKVVLTQAPAYAIIML